MNIIEEQIREKGYEILKALQIDNYFKEAPSFVKEKTFLIINSTEEYEEEGWEFTVNAPHWQLDNNWGLYIIRFLQDGTPHSFQEITGGRTLPLFLHQTTTGAYETYLSIEDVPD